MAFDAVVSLVERAYEICAWIRELESLPVTPLIAFQFELDEVARGAGLDRHQVMHVELMRLFEQHANFMFLFALRRKRSPGGVMGGDLQLFFVRTLLLEPTRHMVRETQLGKRLLKESF